MRLASDWVRGTKTLEQKQEIYNQVVGSYKALELLKGIIFKRRDNLIGSPSEDDYKNTSWANLQAHRNGRLQELDYIIKLLTISDKE